MRNEEGPGRGLCSALMVILRLQLDDITGAYPDRRAIALRLAEG
jgi:hypothetical protein